MNFLIRGETYAWLIFTALLMVNFAFAAAPQLETKNTDSSSFQQQIDNVHSAMLAGGRYEFVTPLERERVEKMMSEILSLLTKGGSIAQLSTEEKVRVFNAQEEVNGILTHRDRERLICENRKSVGSHQKQTLCQTYGELQQRQRTDADLKRKLLQTGCFNAEKGSCSKQAGVGRKDLGSGQ